MNAPLPASPFKYNAERVTWQGDNGYGYFAKREGRVVTGYVYNNVAWLVIEDYPCLTTVRADVCEPIQGEGDPCGQTAFTSARSAEEKPST